MKGFKLSKFVMLAWVKGVLIARGEARVCCVYHIILRERKQLKAKQKNKERKKRNSPLIAAPAN